MVSRVRRRAAALLLAGALTGVAGCGDQQAPARGSDPVDDGPATGSASSSATPVQTETPASEEPPPLDRTELDANLAKLSAADRALADHYLDEARLGEGTWVVASPMTVDEAKARLLGPSPRRATAADDKAYMNAEISSYSFLQVGDGVVAWEDTGFAQPPERLLAALSRDGAVSAMACENIEAMTSFGYARDGEVVFYDFEYAFVPDLDQVPAEVRDLAALAWDDLEGPMVETADWFAVAMAMSEKVTGVRATNAVRDVRDSYVVPLPWGPDEG